jgi:C4-dicarboxylate transporter DctQ subunit
MKKVFSAIKAINQSMYWIAVAATVVMVCLVSYDIIIRTLGLKPTAFGFELNSWLVGVIAYLTAGFGVLHDKHMRVDIFYRNFSDRKKSVVAVISGVVGLVVAITFVWIGGGYVLSLKASGAVASTGFNIPLWIKWSIVPIGGILLGLQLLVQFTCDLYHAITGTRLL